jgi:hypothetical protein
MKLENSKHLTNDTFCLSVIGAQRLSAFQICHWGSVALIRDGYSQIW